ncbi:hypothetical protein RKD35_000487 [Streptomyces albogriseolus]
MANMPPISGDTAAPADRKPLHSATELARSFAVRVTAVIEVREPGNMAPAPRPLSAAPTHSTCTVGARAATVLPATTRAVPAMTSLRRPKRSPRTPKVNSKQTTAIMNAAVIQVSWDPRVWRSSWKSPFSETGRAFATCATNTAAQAAASVPA